MTLDVHRPLEGLIGIVLMVVPFLLDFGLGGSDFPVSAIVLGAIIGAPVATLGFAGGRTGDPVSPSLHVVLDRVLSGALLLATLLFMLAAEGTAAVFFGFATAAHAGLGLATRYVERR